MTARIADPEILRPASLLEALRLRDEHLDAVAIHGGTDVMVAVNFRRMRPRAYLDLKGVPELAVCEIDSGTLRIGAGATYTQLLEPRIALRVPALAQAARSVGSPQIRNRGTIGGNLATGSPAGDTLPPLLALGAVVELASRRGSRVLDLGEFLLGPKQTALAPDELITHVTVRADIAGQIFMKIGPRNAMVIAVASLAVVVDPVHERVRAAYGSAGPVVGLVELPLAERARLPEAVAIAAHPIDDIRGSAEYRRHALRILAQRGLRRCMA